MTFVAATNNQKKFEEFKRILEPLGHVILSLEQSNVCINVNEVGKTFEENAEIKAVAICRVTDLPVIADDSGLEVDALNGAPGIYSARYAGKSSTDKEKIAKLLENIRHVPKEKRNARFVCAICCIFPDGRIIKSKGVCEGSIAFEPSGSGGFGYDPIFIENTTGRLFSELSGAEKDAVSHRGKALRELQRKLKDMLCRQDCDEIDN